MIPVVLPVRPDTATIDIFCFVQFIRTSNILSLLPTRGDHVKFDLQFVFDLDCASGHADGSDTEIALVQDVFTAIVSVGTDNVQRNWPLFPMQRQRSSYREAIAGFLLYVVRLKTNLAKLIRIKNLWPEHAFLDLLAFFHGQIGIQDHEFPRINH